MALIKCPECNKDISDRAVSCPNCGFPISDAKNELREKEDVEEKPFICPHCGEISIVDNDGYCSLCDMRVEPYGHIKEMKPKIYEVISQEKPTTLYTECPICGFYNLAGVYTCQNCSHKYTLGEYIVKFPDGWESEEEERHKRKCPKCGSENIHAFVKTVQISEGKTKTRYTVNINLLHPLTVFNKKEKAVKKPRYVDVGKFQCDNCGKIFY